ncbi:MAG: ABC-2 family transporter protein [Myxococcota bacterium]
MAVAYRLRPYLYYARCAFQRRAAYRLANFTGIAVNFFFFLIHAQVFLAFFGERRLLGGWRPEDAVLYFAISEALLMVLIAFPDRANNVSVRIRSGDIVCDLARPVSLYARDLAERLGTSLYYLPARAFVLALAAGLLYGIAPPLRAELWLAPLSLLLGVGVMASIWYLTHATAFWAEAATGPVLAITFVHTVLGGVVVPLDFYPEGLRVVCDALPFRAALYTPVALLAGRLEGGALVFGLVHQAGWFALLALAARAVEARGVMRLAAQGG